MGAPRLLHVFPSFSIGGIESRTCRIINHYGKASDHVIFSVHNDYSIGERLLPNTSVRLLADVRCPSGIPARLVFYRRLLRRVNPDLLLTYNWGSFDCVASYSLFRPCPLIHAQHGFTADESDGQKGYRALLRRILLRRASYLVVPSQGLVEIAANDWKIPGAKIRYMKNGIDLDRYSVSADTAGAGIRRRGETIIGSVGSLSTIKNHQRLLRVFSRLGRRENVRVCLVGDGSERTRLQQYAEDHGIADRVLMVGYREDVHAMLREFDIFCLPSDSEQMPHALIEAMASGLPAVATDVGDVKSMVSEENRRFIVSVADEDGFLRNVRVLLDDPRLRRRLGEANRARAWREFGQENMYREYGALYRRAIHEWKRFRSGSHPEKTPGTSRRARGDTQKNGCRH